MPLESTTRAKFWSLSDPNYNRFDSGFVTDNSATRKTAEFWATSPRAMNESGQVVGSVITSDQSSHTPTTFTDGPFLYNGQETTLLVADTLAGSAEEINERGDVVGSVTFETGSRSFLYRDEHLEYLVGADGAPLQGPSLNDQGQIVAFAAVPGEAEQFRVIFFDDGRMLDVNQWLSENFSEVDPVASLLGQSVVLNDLGQIAITARLLNGNSAFYVLTPIPEPQTYVMMLSGLCSLAFIVRRRRARISFP